MKKLTMEDWTKIQRERPARYYVQSEADGVVRVTFDSEMSVTKKGDEDTLGNIWQKDWEKAEAKVIINGETKLYSLGGTKWSFVGDLIRVCRENNITPETLVGSVFDIKKTGPFSQEITYVGKSTDIEKEEVKSTIDENIVNSIKNVINDLKHNSPELIKSGLLKSDFVKACSIRGQLKPTQVEVVLPLLDETGIIKISSDKVFVV